MLVFATIVLIAIAPAGANAGDKPAPTRLWREYPLKPSGAKEPLRTTSEVSNRSRPARPPVAVTPDSSDGGRTLVAVLALAGSGAVALVLFALLFARIGPTTKGASTMSNFMRRRPEDRPEPDSESPASTPSRTGEAVTPYTLAPPSQPVSGHDVRVSDPADVRAIMSFDELGQTVANVLRSAQDNAAHVIATARAQANSILEAAEAEAKEARAQLDAEVAERRSESERIRADANRYSEERRRQADVEANQVRADAEAHALRLRETGEATRRNLEEKGLARRQELIEASSTMETRLRETLTTCQEVVVQIEELLENGHGDVVEEARAEVAEDAEYAKNAEDAYAEVFAKAREEDEQREDAAGLDEELLHEARDSENEGVARPKARSKKTDAQKA
jgi:hypothetical protein